MPRFLEDKLKKEYPGNPGAVYGTLNKLGAMHGNKETEKGKAMERKHEVDEKKHKVVKKMSPLGKLKSMLNDKPHDLAGHLEWFKKHGTGKANIKPPF